MEDRPQQPVVVRPPYVVAACVLALLAACNRAPAPAAAPPQPNVADPAPAASSPATPAPASDRWALPGPVHPRVTDRELDAHFGKANLRRDTVPGAEGIGSVPVVLVYPDDPRQRLELIRDEGDPDGPIRSVRASGVDGPWHTVTGIRLGMPLADLVALNGAPVSFYGLSWDYGGGVADWHGGRLANAEGDPVIHQVVLGTREGDDSDGLPIGDALFRSDDARWPRLGERLAVRELAVSWPRDDG